MRKVKLLFVALIVASMAFSGCKKYEEGPSLSLRSKTTRISGEWKIVKQQYNGVDVDIDNIEKSFTYEYKKEGEFYRSSTLYPNLKIEGTWEFNSEKTRLIIKANLLGQPYNNDLTIIRLTNKELIYEEIENGDKSRTELEKI